MNLRHLIAYLFVAIASYGCGGQGQSSVEELVLWTIEAQELGSDLYVKVRPKVGAKLEEIIRGDLFEGFFPSITHDEAIERFGEPMFIRRFGHGTLFYYPVSLGTVEIAHKRTQSWDAAMVWKLTVFPKDADPGAILHQSVAKYLTSGHRFVCVSILNWNGTTHTKFVTRKGKIMYAMWINAPEARKETAQESPGLAEG